MGEYEVFEYRSYLKVMESGLPPMIIVQAHLLAEHYMNQIISIYLNRGEKITRKADLSFYQKIVLVDSFDIISDRIIQGLKSLNSVRNKCAHEINKEISLSDIDRIGRNFGMDFSKMRKKGIDDHRKLLSHVLGMFFAKMSSELENIEDEIIKSNNT